MKNHCDTCGTFLNDNPERMVEGLCHRCELEKVTAERDEARKACAFYRMAILNGMSMEFVDQSPLSDCGKGYIHVKEIKPLVEALKIALQYLPAVHATGYLHEARFAAEQALAHAERVMKGDTQ